MKRYSRQELLEATGARTEELAEIEASGLLVPVRRRRLFRPAIEYYTSDQCEVLRQIIRTRRLLESHRAQVARDPIPTAIRSTGRDA